MQFVGRHVIPSSLLAVAFLFGVSSGVRATHQDGDLCYASTGRHQLQMVASCSMIVYAYLTDVPTTYQATYQATYQGNIARTVRFKKSGLMPAHAIQILSALTVSIWGRKGRNIKFGGGNYCIWCLEVLIGSIICGQTRDWRCVFNNRISTKITLFSIPTPLDFWGMGVL